MSFVSTCPQCQQPVSVGAEWQGRQVQCPRCGALFVSGPGAWPPPASNPWSAGSGNGAGGPTDRQIRIGAAASIPLMLIGWFAASFSEPTLGALMVGGLAPIVFSFAIAALFDPNVPRAAGKYGTHLPVRVKVIAGVVAVIALVLSLASISFMMWR